MSVIPSSWSAVEIGPGDTCLYLMKVLAKDDGIDVWLTDLSHIWQMFKTPEKIMDEFRVSFIKTK